MTETDISALAVFQQLKSKMSTLIDPVVQAEGLTPLQACVLLMIARGDAGTVGELSGQLRSGQANTSTLCKKLEKNGYIVRTRNPEDERVVTLTLTGQGRETLERIQATFRRYEQMLEQTDRQVREDLRRGLAAANAALDYLNEQTKGDQERC